MMRAGIAGAGVMGRLLAFYLIKAGWEVTLYEAEDTLDALNCSMVAAGLLNPVAELGKAHPLIYHLGMEAVQKHYPGIIEELNGFAAEPIFFQIKGSLVVAHPKDQAELQLLIDTLRGKIGSQPLFQCVNQAELIDLEPQLNKWENAYYFLPEGNIDNQAYLAALAAFLTARGANWRLHTRVQEVKPNKIILEDRVETFDLVCDCRGLGATSNFPEIRGIRGELLWLYAPEVSIQRPVRLMHPRHSIYIVPRPNSVYIIGASQIETHDTSPISVRTVLELLSSAYYVHSGFAEARLLKTMTQNRPTLADHLPKLRYAPGFIAINGLYRHGFLISPTLVQEVMQWLESGIKAVPHPEIWEPYHD